MEKYVKLSDVREMLGNARLVGDEYNVGYQTDDINLKQLPIADVEPVKHGRWHSRFYFRESTKAYDCEMCVCSICESEWSYDAETGVSDYNYCPNCGARMR